MKKLNYILIFLVLGALALGAVNMGKKDRVEVVTKEISVPSVSAEKVGLLEGQLNGHGDRIVGIEKKMSIVEKGFSAIISSLQILIGQSKESQALGGLVHNVQEIFSQGLKAGVDERQSVNNNGQLIGPIGGAEWATTTRSDATTTLDNICSYGQWTLTKGVAGAEYNLRFPSTSTMALSPKNNQCLSKVGDTHTIMVYNASSTSTGKATTTFSTYLNTGIEIVRIATTTPSGDITNTSVLKAQIINGEIGILKFWRRSNGTTTVIFQRAYGIGNP